MVSDFACHDMEYDNVAVWTDLLMTSLRSLTPLVQQTNHNVNPSPNFHSHPTPIIFSQTGPAHKAGRHGKRYADWRSCTTSEIGGVNTPHTLRGRLTVCSMLQFSPKAGRP